MSNRQLLVAENGMRVVRPTFGERLGDSVLANSLTVAFVRTLMRFSNDQTYRAFEENVDVNREAILGRLKLESDFKKGRIDGQIIPITSEQASKRTDIESPDVELAKYKGSSKER